MIFNDEEITEERIEERAREVLKQIEAVRRAFMEWQKRGEKLETIPKKDKKKYRRQWWKTQRVRVELSQFIRRIEFTELVKRRLIDQLKEAVEEVRRVQREADGIDKTAVGERQEGAEAEGRGPQGC